MSCRAKSKAEKNYQRRLIWAMLVYVVVVMATALAVRRGHVSGWALYVVAVIPCLPVLRLIQVLGLYLHEETDEFQRLLAVRSILLGGAAMLVVSAFSDFLRSFANVGALSPFMMFSVFWFTFGIAQGVQARMNRADGDEEQA